MSTRVLSAPVTGHLLLPYRVGITTSSSCSPVTRVKRCLFPSDNNSQVSELSSLQQAQLELQRQVEADCKRWSFDFVREIPIAGGRLEWTPAATTTTDETTTTSSSSAHRMRQSQITGVLQKNLIKSQC